MGDLQWDNEKRKMIIIIMKHIEKIKYHWPRKDKHKLRFMHWVLTMQSCDNQTTLHVAFNRILNHCLYEWNKCTYFDWILMNRHFVCSFRKSIITRRVAHIMARLRLFLFIVSFLSFLLYFLSRYLHLVPRRTATTAVAPLQCSIYVNVHIYGALF